MTVAAAAATVGALSALLDGKLDHTVTRNWLSGYFANGAATVRDAWAKEFGFPCQVMTSFFDFEPNWGARADNITNHAASGQFLPPGDHTINVLTIGLIPSGAGGSQSPNNARLTQAGTGSDRDGWTQVAQAIKNIGLDSPSTVLRIGHEANGSWYPWSTRNNAGQMGDYVLAWRVAHDAIKAVCPQVRLNLNLCVDRTNASTLAGHYAGDGYVDIVSFDFYDYNINTTTAKFASSGGNNFDLFVGFAKTHGKGFSVDEWGVSLNADPNVRDSPFYIQSMWDSFAAMATKYPGVILYDSYFNSGNNHNFSVNPKSAALYKKLWALTSTPAPSPTPVPPVPSVPGVATGVALGAVTASTAVLSWTGSTGSPDSWNLYLDGTYVHTCHVSERTYTFTGLAAGTAHQVGVCPAIAGREGARANLAVTTAADAPTTPPATPPAAATTYTVTTTVADETGKTVLSTTGSFTG